MPLHTGISLGPYEIQSPLGAGGMGEVYKAKDTRLGRVVAIKVLPGHLASDPHSRDRFDRESKAISSLNHPHICALYDVGSQDGIDFLVMESALRILMHSLTQGCEPPMLDGRCNGFTFPLVRPCADLAAFKSRRTSSPPTSPRNIPGPAARI